MPRAKLPTGDKHAIPKAEAQANLNDYVEEKPKNKGGRPSSFRGEFVAQAKKLCKLGATDLDLAEFFDVDVSTIWRWSKGTTRFAVP
jgi:hypothetical protein